MIVYGEVVKIPAHRHETVAHAPDLPLPSLLRRWLRLRVDATDLARHARRPLELADRFRRQPVNREPDWSTRGLLGCQVLPLWFSKHHRRSRSGVFNCPRVRPEAARDRRRVAVRRNVARDVRFYHNVRFRHRVAPSRAGRVQFAMCASEGSAQSGGGGFDPRWAGYAQTGFQHRRIQPRGDSRLALTGDLPFVEAVARCRRKAQGTPAQPSTTTRSPYAALEGARHRAGGSASPAGC